MCYWQFDLSHWQCHGWDGQSPAAQPRGRFWWTEWHWDRLFLRILQSLLMSSITPILRKHIPFICHRLYIDLATVIVVIQTHRFVSLVFIYFFKDKFTVANLELIATLRVTICCVLYHRRHMQIFHTAHSVRVYYSNTTLVPPINALWHRSMSDGVVTISQVL